MKNKTDISKQYLFQLLETNSPPAIETLAVVLHAVGITLDFKPVTTGNHLKKMQEKNVIL